MELNHENFQRSLENIKVSDEFLASTRLLMKEAAAKPAPRRFPRIAAISGTAAACIAIIAAFCLGGSDEIDYNTAESFSENTSVCGTSAQEEKSEITEDEEAIADEEAVFDADEITEDETDKTANPQIAAVRGSEEDTSAAPERVQETTTAAETSAETSEESEAADDEAAPVIENYSADSGGSNDPVNDEPEDAAEDFADGSGSDEEIFDSYDDVVIDDSDMENPSSAPVEPAFTAVAGGNAYNYDSFSPSDTEKLREFLTLASGDEINAEVTVGDSRSDVFSGAAQDLNAELIGLSGGFILCEDEIFEIAASFSVYDNKSGGLLYTVGIGDGLIAVSVKGGETVYFISDGTEELLALIL